MYYPILFNDVTICYSAFTVTRFVDILLAVSPSGYPLILRVREKINSQILSFEAPAWQGVKEQEYQAYSELSQRCQARYIGA